MRLLWPLFQQTVSHPDVKHKPLKRLPFGPNTKPWRLDYKPPDPPMPDDFYPRKPRHWILSGTPANKTRMTLTLIVCAYGFAGLSYAAYFWGDRYHRWAKFFTGRESPSLDERRTQMLENMLHQKHLLRSGTDVDDQRYAMKDLREISKYSGRLDRGSRSITQKPLGDPAE